MPYSSRHIIEKPRPYRTLLLIISTILLTLFIQRYFFNHTAPETPQYAELTQLQQQAIEQLEKNIKQLSAEKAHLLKLEGIAATAQSELTLEKATTAHLKQQIEQLQEKVLSQDKLIQFYRSVTDGKASTKLQFRELSLRIADPETGMIKFRLIVSQGKKITHPITGNILITLNFQQNEQQIVGTYPLNLRMVQIIEGKFQVLKKRTPTSITVILKQQDKVKLTKTYDWSLLQYQ